MVAFALDKVAMLVIVFMLARILGGADYGRLSLAQGLVNSVQIFVVLGTGTVLARYIPAMRAESVRRAVEIINLCVIMMAGTAVLFAIVGLWKAPLVATRILDLSASSVVPYMLVAWILMTALTNLLLTIMQSFERGSAIGLVSLVAALLAIVIVPLFAMDLGLIGVIVALIAVEVVKGGLLLILYVRLLNEYGVAIMTPAQRADVSLLWRFGLPAFLNSALWGPTIWLALFTMKMRMPDGLTAVGVFGFSNNVLGAVILISSLANRAALPIQASMHAMRQWDQLRRFTWRLMLGQAGVASMIALMIGVASPIIMQRAGADFANHWPVLVIMVTSGVIMSGQNALGNYLLVIDRTYFIVFSLLPWAAIIIAAAFFFAPFGAQALAGGLLVATVIRSALFLWGWLQFPVSSPPMIRG
jgi:O-antigen/teichoic acid export membrane protein